LAEATTVPIPTDPATGKPFGYVVDGNTFTLSVEAPAGETPSSSNQWKYVVTLGK
jgi:hypothetical protein